MATNIKGPGIYPVALPEAPEQGAAEGAAFIGDPIIRVAGACLPVAVGLGQPMVIRPRWPRRPHGPPRLATATP